MISGSGTVFQSLANYACDNGYNLVGVQNRTCESNTVWSGEEPECKGMISFIRLLLSNQLGLFLTT